jgi:hypothetical protein
MDIGFLRGIPWKVAMPCAVTEVMGRVVRFGTGKLVAKP